MNVSIAGLATADSGTGDYATSSFTTTSQSPGADRLQLLALSYSWAAARASPATITVTGCNLTWVQIASRAFWPDSTNFWNAVYIFRALGASPTTGQLTVSAGSVDIWSWAYSWVECTGMDTSGTNGSGAIVQSASNAATGLSLTVTLAAFASANNATYGAFGSGNDFGNIVTHTPGTGFTELHDTYAEFCGLGTQWRNDNDTSVDHTISNPAGSEFIGGIAIEIADAAVVAATRRYSLTTLGVG